PSRRRRPRLGVFYKSRAPLTAKLARVALAGSLADDGDILVPLVQLVLIRAAIVRTLPATNGRLEMGGNLLSGGPGEAVEDLDWLATNKVKPSSVPPHFEPRERAGRKFLEFGAEIVGAFFMGRHPATAVGDRGVQQVVPV